MSFFKQFPKVEYDFNRTGVKQNMVDLFRSVRPLPTFLDNYTGYKFYEIKNGERPDIVSQRLYGSSMFYWTLFLVNDHLHDGYRAWPLSQEDLQEYMAKQYEGYVIETSPKVSNNFENSLAGRFQMGETVTGSTSDATGKVTRKIIDLSQLVIQEVTGVFQAPELIIGSTSTDSVSSNRVYKYLDAPYYWYKAGDKNKKPLTNADHITGGTNNSQLEYVTNRAHLEEKNDEYSRIRVVAPNSMNDFVRRFKELIRQ